MRTRVMTLLALVLVEVVAFAQSQAAVSQFVVVLTGSKEYHTPSCPLIKDRKDVSVMTRAQAHGKGYTPHNDCTSAAATAAKDADTVYVYVSKTDAKRYHKPECKELPKDAKKVVLDKDAVKGRWPCTVCRPPIIKKPAPAVP